MDTQGVCLYSQDEKSIRGKIVIFLYVSNYIISWIVMAVANTLLLLTMRDLQKIAKSASDGYARHERRTSSSWDKQKKETLKFSRLIMVMSFCYSLSWLPFTVKVLLKYYGNWDNLLFNMMTVSLAGCDPFINPLVCVVMSKSFRSGYRRTVVNAFKCVCKERGGRRWSIELPAEVAQSRSRPSDGAVYDECPNEDFQEISDQLSVSKIRANCVNSLKQDVCITSV
ncbi:uncharacterized protein LOC117123347 isoform X2 [Anneissia japonica]|nr:uncharacterized protein LOC117123347 isoform X2 [Anneissia japonica]